MSNQPYTWRVGDVFTDGTHRWAVDAVHGEKAVLRSCGSSWATTIPLAFGEWREGGRWRLEGVPSLQEIQRRDGVGAVEAMRRQAFNRAHGLRDTDAE